MAPPESILCLRHGEKPPKLRGEEPPGLSTPGRQRARQLATALGPDGRLLPAGAAAPSHIFVPEYHHPTTLEDETKSHRPYLTIEPLRANLERLDQPAEVVTCPRDDVRQLAGLVLASGPLVVVCWEHDALTAWLQRFAGMGHVVEPPGAAVEPPDYLPTEWDGKVYDVLWHLKLVSQTRTYEFSVHPQDIQVTAEPVFDEDGGAVGFVNREAGLFAT